MLGGFKDGTLHMFSVDKEKEMMSYYGHIDEVTDAQFSIDGKLIISSSLDRTIRVFKPKTGEE